MAFPIYLREASQMGLTKDEILGVWESETEIERIKVETQLLETKLRKSDIHEVSISAMEETFTVLKNLIPTTNQLLQEVVFLREELKSQRQLQEDNLSAVGVTQFKLEELKATLINDFHFLRQETQRNEQQNGSLWEELTNLKRFITEYNESKLVQMKNFIDQKIDILNQLIKSIGPVETRSTSQEIQIIHSKSNARSSEERNGLDTRSTQTSSKQTVRESPSFQNNGNGRHEPHQCVEGQWTKMCETAPGDNKKSELGLSQKPGFSFGITDGLEFQRDSSDRLSEEQKSNGDDLGWKLAGARNRTSADAERVPPEISEEVGWRPLHQSFYNTNVGITHQENFTNTQAMAAREIHDVDFIPATKSILKLSNCGALADIENRDFYTDYLYTRPKTCRVRMRLWFNKRGHLGVQALVSEGVFDENHTWPLIFSGNGYIWNPESRKYTLVWTVSQQECSRPKQGEELPLGASVVLITLRDAHNIVTHELLVKKHYIKNNRLRFRWDLKAEEMITEPLPQNSVAFWT